MLTRVYDEVRACAVAQWAGNPPATVATDAVAHVVRELQEAGLLLVERPVPPAEMTAREAAELLCLLSRTRKLDDPEQDAQQLLDGPAMVDYAWRSAVVAGIPPEDITRAHAAHRVLLAHHRAK